ncbi:MAG: glycosyltransferase family 9 protein [Ignavibacteriales bacterium]|nr:MAG: glycosyltransferase family 9 protein [Ignavibacteriales bacterium]
MSDSTKYKILIIRLSSLGDILLTTPVVRAINKEYPNSQIDYVVKKQYSSSLQYNPFISSLYLYEKEKVKSIKDQIHKKKYDMIIDLQNNLRSCALTFGLGTEVKRFKKPTFKKLLLVWTKINLLKEIKPMPMRYAEIAALQLDDNGLDLFIPKNINPQLAAGKKYIGICPGAKHFTKQWPEEYFIELGNRLSSQNSTIVIFGGKDDQKLCEAVSSKIENSINLCNNNDLLQTAIDMKQCQHIICNDSGLMHTATAVGTSITAIFGSTVSEFGFLPYLSANSILENNSLSCRPCSHIGRSSCPQTHFKCMKEIKPNTVFDHVKSFL